MINESTGDFPDGLASPLAAERTQFCDFNSCIDDSISNRDMLIPSKNLDSIRRMMGEGNYAVPVVDSIKSMNVIKDASLVRVGGHGPDSESDEEFEDVQE